MRRVIAAVFGAAIGTALLIALKAGPGAGKEPAPVPVAAAPTPSGPAPGPAAPRSSAPTGSRGAAATHGPTPPAQTAAPTRAAGPTGTFTGSVARTEYGPVQVRIVMAGGRMTDVSAVQLPNSSARSVQLSGRAGPILRQEALSAQSATIDTVSGATVTSQGYRTSLQAALDAAHRG